MRTIYRVHVLFNLVFACVLLKSAPSKANSLDNESSDAVALEIDYSSPALETLVTGDPRGVPERPEHFLFTVVFDLDETLGTFVPSQGFVLRPHVRRVLSYLKKHKVELILWTAGSEFHAEKSLQEHGLSHYFDAVIHRGPSWWNPYFHVKNLQLLNRNGLILIDNSRKVVSRCQGNAIHVKDFDPAREQDSSLLGVRSILKTVIREIRKLKIPPRTSLDVNIFIEEYLYKASADDFPVFEAPLMFFTKDPSKVRHFGKIAWTAW